MNKLTYICKYTYNKKKTRVVSESAKLKEQKN